MKLAKIQTPVWLNFREKAPGSIPPMPRLMLIGGPDVDARLDLMHTLEDHFNVSAVGSEQALRENFSKHGFDYFTYSLSRRVNPLADLRSLVEQIVLFWKNRPQVVHTFDTKPNVWGRIAARLAGVPVVIGTITGIGSLYGDDRLKTRVVRKIYQALQSIACHISDLTIFQNHDDMRYFIEEGLVPERKTALVLGSGVSTNQFSPLNVSTIERKQLRDEFCIGQDDIVITMVSRIIRSKGVMEYVNAAQNVGADRPNTRFLLVGREDTESVDRLSAEELALLRQNVMCTGHRRDIPGIMAISDIFVLPSAYHEGIPRVLLEAASMGLALVTTDTPGCNEVVIDGLNGYLVPVGDSAELSRVILELVDQPDLRRLYGESSRQRAVEVFDLSIISGEIQNLYQQMLVSKKRKLSQLYQFENQNPL